MEKGHFRPHEAYETSRSLIPQHSIGFRGQPVRFMEDAVINGFDKSRFYHVVNLNKEWKKMRQTREKIHRYFDMAASNGKTGYSDASANIRTIDDYLKVVQQNPELYSSILLLNFRGFRSKWYTTLSFLSPHPYPHRKVPSKYIEGVITLKEEDVCLVREQLQKRGINLESKDFRAADRQLGRRMLRRTIQAVMSFTG